MSDSRPFLGVEEVILLNLVVKLVVVAVAVVPVGQDAAREGRRGRVLISRVAMVVCP